MFDLDFTFVWTAVNLVILYLVLKKFLFKPVTEFIENRKNSVIKDIEDGKALREQGESFKMEYEDKLKGAGQAIETLKEKAVKKANAEYDSIIARAKKEADTLLEKARMEIDRERTIMLREIQSSVLSVSLAAASKVLSKSVDNDENRKLVEDFLKDEGVA